jgi:murein DD-endopeptidase MepM/ murein hydrolase activator NlpD
LGEFDHFYFVRPIEADQVNWPLATYRYGGIFFGDDVVHTGVDIDAREGTPIHAAAAGRIIWVGYGLFTSAKGNTDDPYGLAVAIEHDFGYKGKTLYTIYAHMDSINVNERQRVEANDILGYVGETGLTTGPHLHFEVRLGANSYYTTRNPELWVAPPQGWGALAGRIMHKDFTYITSFKFKVISLDTDQRWEVLTYAGKTIISDDYYHENFALSDLPAGQYEIQLVFNENKKFTQQFEIKPGQITYLIYREERGFLINPEPTPAYKPATPLPSPTP